jgi:hypothetical protein
LICGVPGHTSSYCPDNSSVSSSVSSSSTIQKEKKEPRYALATDDVRYPPHSIRLPPIQKQQQQQQQQQQQPLYRPAPRIVYANELPSRSVVDPRREFPSLPNLSSLRRFENDEPKLKRESAAAAEASPVHSPVKVKYNKNSNPFGVLDNNDNDDSDVESDRDREEERKVKVPLPKKQENPPSSSSSWASIAAGRKSTVVPVVAASKQPQRTRSRFSIIVPTAISTAPLLPPMSFKPKPVSASDLEKKKQVNKLWGDTDSEDDEEFLKRQQQ